VGRPCVPQTIHVCGSLANAPGHTITTSHTCGRRGEAAAAAPTSGLSGGTPAYCKKSALWYVSIGFS
jgi:hypothetical protein